MLKMTFEQYEQIVAQAKAEYPYECCGLIAGVIDGETREVKKVYPLTNIDKSAEHFSMDPKEQFTVVKDARNNNWVLLGNYHSHPSTPSRPSEEDKRLAYDPNASYLILSLMDFKNPVLNSFRLKAGNVSPEEITVSGI